VTQPPHLLTTVDAKWRGTGRTQCLRGCRLRHIHNNNRWPPWCGLPIVSDVGKSRRSSKQKRYSDQKATKETVRHLDNSVACARQQVFNLIPITTVEFAQDQCLPVFTTYFRLWHRSPFLSTPSDFHGLCNCSGSLAIFAAIGLASSFASNLAADRRSSAAELVSPDEERIGSSWGAV
jgi:hypothetical protein